MTSMKKVILSLVFLSIGMTSLFAQKYFTREGNISFSSTAALENIEATNNTATAVMDIESGRMEFAVLIKAFHFEKALMQEHFNENYMESSKFPKATFKGNIVDMSAVDFTKDGSYDVSVKGDLTIHGVTKEVTVPGQITVANGAISAKSTFEVLVADYGIEIPAVVRDNIAKIIQIAVAINYEEFKKGS